VLKDLAEVELQLKPVLTPETATSEWLALQIKPLLTNPHVKYTLMKENTV